jgi:localization factor PodJL
MHRPDHIEQSIAAFSNELEEIRIAMTEVMPRRIIESIQNEILSLHHRIDENRNSGTDAQELAGIERVLAKIAAVLGALIPAEPRTGYGVASHSDWSLAHLEQRVTSLLEQLETAFDPRSGDLSRVEGGLHDILRHLDKQQGTYAALAENRRSSEPPDSGLTEIKRQLADIRFGQTESNRNTQDALEVLHDTLGHVVDRLAVIQGDLREVRSAPAAQPPFVQMPFSAEAGTTARKAARPQQWPNSELPNPEVHEPELHKAAAALGNFQAAPHSGPPMLPRAISDILKGHAALPGAAIAPDLSPDRPLELGTRQRARVATPAERVAASVVSDIAILSKQPGSSSSFIASVRRAALPKNSGRAGAKAVAGIKKNGKNGSTITSKIRLLLVGASVWVIILGTFRAMDVSQSRSTPNPEAEQSSSGPPAVPAQAPAENSTEPAAPGQVTPSMTSPTPIGRQSQYNAAPNIANIKASVDIPPAPPQAGVSAASVQRGQCRRCNSGRARKPQVRHSPAVVKRALPDGIAGPELRAAAMKGDATAAYELGLWFAEAEGLATNYEEAAKWYDRAAQAGVVPAVFQLGTLYEKGLGVKKDADIARRYYVQAAERGNANAMHNLAVLEANGGGRGANYNSAAQWFRKAANRGIADSRFNLAVLYARGMGVEQNLAEAYKWFSLAAALGDAEAASKRDGVAKRLDAQSLAAAKLAVQTFSPEPQPSDAVNVPTPAGGWDSAPAQASSKPAAKALATKRAER